MSHFCKGCGREEDVCSRNPCPGVISDRDDDIRTAARAQYGSDDVAIDEDAIISRGENGAWVQAWVFVDKAES